MWRENFNEEFSKFNLNCDRSITFESFEDESTHEMIMFGEKMRIKRFPNKVDRVRPASINTINQ